MPVRTTPGWEYARETEGDRGTVLLSGRRQQEPSLLSQQSLRRTAPLCPDERKLPAGGKKHRPAAGFLLTMGRRLGTILKRNVKVELRGAGGIGKH